MNCWPLLKSKGCLFSLITVFSPITSHAQTIPAPVQIHDIRIFSQDKSFQNIPLQSLSRNPLYPFLTQTVWPAISIELQSILIGEETFPQLMRQLLRPPLNQVKAHPLSIPLDTDAQLWRYILPSLGSVFSFGTFIAKGEPSTHNLQTFEDHILTRIVQRQLATHPKAAEFIHTLSLHTSPPKEKPSPAPVAPEQIAENLAQIFLTQLKLYLTRQPRAAFASDKDPLPVARASLQKFLELIHPNPKLWNLNGLTTQECQDLGQEVLTRFPEELFEEMLINVKISYPPFKNAAQAKHYLVGKIASLIRERLFEAECYFLEPSFEINLLKSLLPLKESYGFSANDHCPGAIANVLEDFGPLIKKWFVQQLLHPKHLPHEVLTYFDQEVVAAQPPPPVVVPKPSDNAMWTQATQTTQELIRSGQWQEHVQFYSLLEPMSVQWRTFLGGKSSVLDSALDSTSTLTIRTEEPLVSFSPEPEAPAFFTLTMCIPVTAEVIPDPTHVSERINRWFQVGKSTPCDIESDIQQATYLPCLYKYGHPILTQWLNKIREVHAQLAYVKTEPLCIKLTSKLELNFQNEVAGGSASFEWIRRLNLAPTHIHTHIQINNAPLDLFKNSLFQDEPLMTRLNQRLLQFHKKQDASADMARVFQAEIYSQLAINLTYDSLTIPTSLPRDAYNIETSSPIILGSVAVSPNNATPIMIDKPAPLLTIPSQTMTWIPSSTDVFSGNVQFHPITEVLPSTVDQILHKPIQNWTASDMTLLMGCSHHCSASIYLIQQLGLLPLNILHEINSYLGKNRPGHPLNKTVAQITQDKVTENFDHPITQHQYQIKVAQTQLERTQHYLKILGSLTQDSSSWQPHMTDLEYWVSLIPHFEDKLRSLCQRTSCQVPAQKIFLVALIHQHMQHPSLDLSGPSPLDVSLTQELAQHPPPVSEQEVFNLYTEFLKTTVRTIAETELTIQQNQSACQDLQKRRAELPL